MALNHDVASNENSWLANDTEIGQRVDNLDESGLVAAAKRGHAAAFDALWQPYERRILRTMHRITNNREDAEDALQDSLLSAFVHIGDFDGRSSFSTWLMRVAINSALMIRRKKRPALDVSLDQPAGHGANRVAENLLDRSPNPEVLCAQRERERILQKAIGTLRPAVRKVVELQRLQERSLEETAHALGLSVAAAKSRLAYAKASLRESLKPRLVHRSRGRSQSGLSPAA